MLKKLKSLFVVEEEEIKKTTEKKTTAENNGKPIEKSNVSSSVDTPSSSSDVPKTKGSMNTKIMEKLLTVIGDNNQDGFDYIEFKNSIKALEKFDMDEKTMFRSAFATAQTIGASVPQILDSVEFYKKVLAKENTNFSSTLNHQISVKVGDKKKEAAAYEKMIKDEAVEIEKLQARIEKHKTIIEGIKTKIRKDTVSIEQTRSDFETTYYKLVYQIQEDVKKIKKYLQ